MFSVDLPFLITGTHPTAPVRLENGNNELEGRVEIYYSGNWGTVCDDGWDSHDAAVVCHQLNLHGGYAYYNAHFGQGTGVIWLDNVGCSGSEPSLDQCSNREWGNLRSCSHAEDAGVRCTGSNGIYIILCDKNSYRDMTVIA